MCQIALYHKKMDQMLKLCKVETSPYRDDTLSLCPNYWYVITRQPTVLHINCLKSSLYKPLRFPVDLVCLENDCEGISTTLTLPGHSRLIKEDNSILAANHAKTFTLNYTQIRDFHFIQQILPHHLTNSELAVIDKSIPDVKHHSIPVMKQKLHNIITDYPYVLPEYLKILLTGLGMVLVIVIMIVIFICKKRGCTILSTGFLKSKCAPYIANTPSKDIISEPRLQQWRPTSGSSRTPCQIKEIELEPMLTCSALPVPSEKGKSVALNVTMSHCSQLMMLPVPATLEMVAMALEKTTNLDFNQFFKKKWSWTNSRSLHHPFNVQRP